jgi:hypothetical protein
LLVGTDPVVVDEFGATKISQLVPLLALRRESRLRIVLTTWTLAHLEKTALALAFAEDRAPSAAWRPARGLASPAQLTS